MEVNWEAQFIEFVTKEMQQDAAHDLQHVLRVAKTAKALAQEEAAQMQVVLPAAYLHDCVSLPKNHPERSLSSRYAADKAIGFLREIGYPSTYFDGIHHAILTHSFSADIPPQTLEAKIVQDADRLDALGAIGVARCIQVSTALGTGLYSVDDPICRRRVPNDKHFAVDHFYTKLFKLKDKMHTRSAIKHAEQRVAFMENFLAQLEQEVKLETED